MKKYVYVFGGAKAEGKADMKNLLGGKGANLAEMCLLGLPVHPSRAKGVAAISLWPSDYRGPNCDGLRQ